MMRIGIGAAGLALLAACGGSEAPRKDVVAVPTTAGLQQPESVLHDSVADVYVVSNMDGAPLDKDGNGFLSRVSPDGRMLQLRWVAGGENGVTLHAPKGSAIHGDTLYVADIDVIRRFHRTTGAPLGEIPVPGATLLNDVAVGADGSVYVTDTGLRMGAGRMQASGTEAVYRIFRGQMQTVARGAELGSPNGIVVDADGGVTVAGMNSSEVYRLTGGSRTLLRAPRRGLLDGLVRTRGGALLVSDWKRSAAYRIHPDADPAIALRKLPSPADIGYDAKRNRVLVPLMTVNRLEFHPAP
jgi:sugar lactone lactonase YvrE